MYTIAVDAMGGDHGPEVVLEGIAQALKKYDNLEVLVVGNEEVVKPFCESYERALPLFSHSSIAMDEHPVEAYRKKSDSSIVVALQAVKEGRAHAFFSAGHTGAVFTAATFELGRIKGISRPCLATVLPGLLDHETICMDLGANSDCRPEMLLGFARLGAAYAKHYFKKTTIKLGLLSNGSEDIKGNDLTIQTHQLLREELSHDFYGNAEGVDFLLGDFDCIVMDGFSGNVALKTLEGTAKYMAKRIKAATKTSARAALGAMLLKPTLMHIADDLSGDAHGGAILLGVKAPVFIGHGNTNPEAVLNGCRVCMEAIQDKLISTITDSLSKK